MLGHDVDLSSSGFLEHASNPNENYGPSLFHHAVRMNLVFCWFLSAGKDSGNCHYVQRDVSVVGWPW